MLHLTELRGILRYVPQFRDRLFVIALDGAVVEADNFRNLLLDIALLRSLRIGVVLVHGAGYQIRRLAEQTGQTPSNIDGTGVTDGATLQLALTAANRVTQEILTGLATQDLNAACGNALVAHPAGILHGIDHQFTGRVERVNTSMLEAMLRNDILPVIAPLGCDGEGHTFRLNSDAVAVEVARSLGAVKLIYLSARGMVRRGEQLVRQVSVEEAEVLLQQGRDEIEPEMVSKLAYAVRAAHGGVPRIHIIDASVEEGLLAEVFSNEGVGTLIHANEYRAIRPAQKKDAEAIFKLVHQAMLNDEVVQRTRADIECHISDYFVFEVDGNPVACAALHVDAEANRAELAAVCVDPKFENQGIGSKLTHYGEALARAARVEVLYCLSTQAFNFFVQKGGFRLGTPDDLPPTRRKRYDRSGRHSQVLIKPLTSAL
jgi:amino-acid N-acetyltransferase